VYWDGVPYLPLGRDSVYLDLGRISLAPLERVDVLVLPATLRVYLVTARQQSTATASQVRIATGQARTANYRGSYERRWRSGLGLSLVADYNNNDGVGGSSSTAFNSVDLWLNAEYLPTPRVGVSYQIASSAWKRSPSDPAGLVDHFEYKRRDGIFRLFAAAREDGLGPRVDLAFVTTTVSADTAALGRSLSQGALRWDRHRVSVEVGLARRDSFVPLGRPTGLRPLGGLGPTQATRYLTVHAALEPLPGLHLAGWYFDPYVAGGNDFEPPYHARVSATFYSKFWRVYKSGIFALRGRLRVAIRTVNHRYYNPQLKLVFELGGVEGQLRERLRQLLERGHVVVTARWVEPPPTDGAVAVDLARARQVVAAAHELKKK